MDNEIMQFQEDLLTSVRQMKAEQAAHITESLISPISTVRQTAGLSQMQFANRLGISLRTLQQWEKGKRFPTGTAKTLLQVVEKHPEILRDI